MGTNITDQISCPVCGSDARFAYNHPDLEIWRCASCSHAFTRLDRMQEAEDYSTQYYDEEHKNWFENPHLSLFSWIGNNLPSNAQSLIDIGCGRGDFLRHIRKSDQNLELVGVDLSPNPPESGITFIEQDFMTVDIDRKFDVVVSLAAIEHMEDPLSFARRLKEYCNLDGVIIVMTINEQGLLYRLARMALFIKLPFVFNRLYSAHHLNHFSIKSLESLMNNAGMRVEKTYHHNSPLAAVDLPKNLMPIRWLVLGWLACIFAVGKITQMCLSQTIVARPDNRKPINK